MKNKFLLILLITLFNACSPIYVMEAGYEEAKILLGREKIVDVLEDSEYTAEEKEKLKLVLEAREYAQKIGLKPEKSFTYYTKLDREAAAWVVTAAKPLQFELYTWWFPIVGSVPYKGYFTLEEAQEEARKLEEKGYETFVRTTDAFSTLGWFNDPLLSPMLKNDNATIVNIVVHECYHNTYWVKNNVAKNEMLANWAGLNAAVDFYKEKIAEDFSNLNKYQEDYIAATYYLKLDQQLSVVLKKLYDSLKEVYASEAPDEVKLAKKKELFQSARDELLVDFPKITLFKDANNAELYAFLIYLEEDLE